MLLTGFSEDKVRAMVANHKRKPDDKDDDSAHKVWTFLICVCLSANMNSKPLLPINIETNIPHIRLPIGLSDYIIKLYLPVTFDTAAVVFVAFTYVMK